MRNSDGTYRFCDYTGKLVDAPSDLPSIVANIADGLIVWSAEFDGDEHAYRVRYGLQANDYSCRKAAADDFMNCLLHATECSGKFDSDPAYAREIQALLKPKVNDD